MATDEQMCKAREAMAWPHSHMVKMGMLEGLTEGEAVKLAREIINAETESEKAEREKAAIEAEETERKLYAIAGVEYRNQDGDLQIGIHLPQQPDQDLVHYDLTAVVCDIKQAPGGRHFLTEGLQDPVRNRNPGALLHQFHQLFLGDIRDHAVIDVIACHGELDGSADGIAGSPYDSHDLFLHRQHQAVEPFFCLQHRGVNILVFPDHIQQDRCHGGGGFPAFAAGGCLPYFFFDLFYGLRIQRKLIRFVQGAAQAAGTAGFIREHIGPHFFAD